MPSETASDGILFSLSDLNLIVSLLVSCRSCSCRSAVCRNVFVFTFSSRTSPSDRRLCVSLCRGQSKHRLSSSTSIFSGYSDYTFVSNRDRCYILSTVCRESITVIVRRNCIQTTQRSSSFRYRQFSRRSQVQTFGYFSADGVVLVCRECDNGQNTQDGDNDHQLDQGETFLDCFHGITPKFKV